MELDELHKLIAEHPESEWFNDIDVVIQFPNLYGVIRFTGISSFYIYVSNEVAGWNEYVGTDVKVPNDSLIKSSLNFFRLAYSQLENFLLEPPKEKQLLLKGWQTTYAALVRNLTNKPVPYYNPRTLYLLELKENNTDHYNTAYGYIVNGNFQNITTPSLFEYVAKTYSFIKSLGENHEVGQGAVETSINLVNQNMLGYLETSEKSISTNISKLNDIVIDKIGEIDELTELKRGDFDNWFEETQSDFGSFDKLKKEAISNLEKTYDEKLKLSKPAEYWSDRAAMLREQGWFALVGLTILVLAVAISLGYLLWNPPKEIFDSFFGKDKTAAVRWSIIYVTLISFLAFAIRAVNKVMFSSFHLASDAEERHTLTYFYLSLTNNAQVSSEEKQLIMQSLFSRTDTGLLKDDGGPKMPSDSLITKVISK